MPPEQTQPPQIPPEEDNQDQMIIDFLKELEARITALEEKLMSEPEEQNA